MTNPDTTSGTPMTWLIIEDDFSIRDVLQTMCTLWEFDAVSLKDGFEASAYLDQAVIPPPVPQVALIDIRMPGPWGHEISQKIRQHSRLANMVVLLMTAYELPGDDAEQLLVTSGADEIIYKPLPPMDELLAKVQQLSRARGT